MAATQQPSYSINFFFIIFSCWLLLGYNSYSIIRRCFFFASSSFFAFFVVLFLSFFEGLSLLFLVMIWFSSSIVCLCCCCCCRVTTSSSVSPQPYPTSATAALVERPWFIASDVLLPQNQLSFPTLCSHGEWFACMCRCCCCWGSCIYGTRRWRRSTVRLKVRPRWGRCVQKCTVRSTTCPSFDSSPQRRKVGGNVGLKLHPTIPHWKRQGIHLGQEDCLYMHIYVRSDPKNITELPVLFGFLEVVM